MNFIDKFKGFFKNKEVDPDILAANSAISAISDANSAFNDAFESIKPYIIRANHRYDILQNRDSDDIGSSDFQPYTEACLDAHTTAMNNLDMAFDRICASFDYLTLAFAALNSTNDLYSVGVCIYKSSCDIYDYSAEAYNKAAYCSVTDALKLKIQSNNARFEILCLELTAENSAEPDPIAAKTQAETLKAKTVENEAKAQKLEQSGQVADTMAQTFCVKAKAAQARLEEA